ncbi:MAG: arsenate reductase (glutaredoxin) [Candidatus Marinimicrobia bacterium]|nr:arsenate reductase (glutaredoxin) [Candidatus Neomarinimicrobiota bacterium]
MNEYIIYHNPRCSKSRQTLAIMNEKNLDVKIVEYLSEPPSGDELEVISKKLALKPMEFIRKKEVEFTELGLKSYNGTDSNLCKIMNENPKLIERPIVVKGEKAIIGRPPENVLELF